jgi:hypothetical protein
MKCDNISKLKRYAYANLAMYQKGEYEKRFLPLYGLFFENKETGEILGYTENSFSMCWTKNYARLWTLERAKHYLDQHIKSKGNKHGRFFIYRLTRKSPNAKITVDWKFRAENYNKYNFRNIQFKINK